MYANNYSQQRYTHKYYYEIHYIQNNAQEREILIGRHATENLEDGYLGSGRWPSSIKNKEDLVREILEECDSMESLIAAETRYLGEHYGRPGCMNMSPSSTGAAPGDSNPMKRPEVAEKFRGDNHWLRKNPERIEEIRDRQNELVATGDHNLLGDKNPNKDGSISRKTAADGHNVFQTNNPSTRRAAEGVHHWQNGKAPNAGGKLNKKLIAEGRHNLVGPEHNRKMIAEGKNPWVGSAGNLKRLAEGTHPSQTKKVCEHCGKEISVGMYVRWHGDNCKMNKDKNNDTQETR